MTDPAPSGSPERRRASDGDGFSDSVGASESDRNRAVAHETFVSLGVDDEGTHWRADVGFLASSWRCIWNDGCRGIEAEPAPERALGCCSVGAELLDDDEAGLIASLAATLDPAKFQFSETAAAEGVLAPPRDGRRRNTRVVEGACIFLNRPGFEGGSGCALHLAAVDEGDEPLEWKPSICWQVPLRVERSGDQAVLRRWRRADWSGAEADVAWSCAEEPEAFVDARPLAERIGPELDALLGADLAAEVACRVTGR